MITILSLVTSVKDYVEIVHKLIETDSNYSLQSYDELGPLLTYVLLTIKNFFYDLIHLNWLQNIWNLPIIIPDISSSMISEISVLDGYFHNTFNFLDTPISYGSNNGFVYSLQKLSIGLINSLFLWLPTSTAHIITLRRFIMQGIEAGYIAGLGTLCGSILWIACIIFGCRFFVIPWISLDIFRYLLGFILLVKYMWDNYNERRMILENLSKQKIFLLNFLLALTEQTSIFPFLSNLSIGTETSIIESFPSENYSQFLFIHGSYILGLIIGSLSLLHLTCWFVENPGFKIYMWLISSFKVSSNFYYKILNFTFLYLTMICSISSIPYYGLDYTLTNPLGFVSDDRLLDQKLVLETSFLNTKASDRNTRRNRGRHGRRERWKRRIRKYRTFDASLYDQGIYDLFSIEDLNYGFDKFWLRRKIRNHRVRFRFFPEPWMRSFKKQLAKPRLESYSGPRQEFFRILFEQVYHPSFHEYKKVNINQNTATVSTAADVSALKQKELEAANQTQTPLRAPGLYTVADAALSAQTPTASPTSLNTEIYQHLINPTIENTQIQKKRKSIAGSEYTIKNNLINENSMLRKFIRKVNLRIKSSEIARGIQENYKINKLQTKNLTQSIYSKRWKEIFSKLNHDHEKTSTQNSQLKGFLKNFYNKAFTKIPSKNNINYPNENLLQKSFSHLNFNKKDASQQNISKKDKEILMYRSMLIEKNNTKNNQFNHQVLFHPIKFYLEKQKAFERKLRYYTPTVFRKFSIENNAPYFRGMMKQYFYFFKPNLRWEKTIKNASLRKARRKRSRRVNKIQDSEKQQTLMPNSDPLFRLTETIDFSQKNGPAPGQTIESDLSIINRLKKPTHNFSVVSKKASRYRFQIYKDVLQHWYYSPFNRLLLKFDIDSFINRQPKSHFLTQKEENLLHLRRFLLAEHYNTLRWYSYMQHYRSMKTKIGGTKSFASRTYNQQFQGTFKKIRHLFAITPSQTLCNSLGNECKDPTLLKFDQPLYNDSFNNTKNSFQNNLVIHEELLTNNSSNLLLAPQTQEKLSGHSNDFLIQSTNIIRDYLNYSTPIKQEYIKNLITKKNYSELTKFIFKGQKLRGTNALTNENKFSFQEKDYLLTLKEQDDLNSLTKNRMKNFLKEINLQQDLWLNLLKKWKRKINNQEFLKNYLIGRIEKREKRKQKKEKNFKNKMTQFEDWLNNKYHANLMTPLTATVSTNAAAATQTSESSENKKIQINSGVQKAIIESVSGINKFNLEIMNSKEKLFWKSKIKNGATPDSALRRLNYASQLKTEHDINSSLNSLSKIIQKLKLSNYNNKIGALTTLKKNNFGTAPPPPDSRSLKRGEAGTRGELSPALLGQAKLKIIYKKYKSNLSSFLSFNKLFMPLKALNEKSLENWRKKQRKLNRQKRSRKELIESLHENNKQETYAKLSIDRLENFLKKNSNDTNRKENETLKMIYSSYEKNKRQKRYFNRNQITTNKLETLGSSKSFEDILENSKISNSLGEKRMKPNFLSKLLRNKFKRKRSPHRRSRTRRHRGIIRKRTLSDSLKRELKNFRKYGSVSDQKFDNENKKLKIYQKIKNNLSVATEQSSTHLENIFLQKSDSPKQRRSKQKKQRSWKQKRSKYFQKSRKYKKRRRSTLSKIRRLHKKLKRIQSKIQIQNWWWKQFLPSFQATTDSLWQIEKDNQIKEKLNELSKNTGIKNFIERDNLYNLEYASSSSVLPLETVAGATVSQVQRGSFATVLAPVGSKALQGGGKTEDLEKILQIGDYDFKPLSIPQALRLRENNKNQLTSNSLEKKIIDPMQSQNLLSNKKENVVDQISENLLMSPFKNSVADKKTYIQTIKASNSLLNINTLPFYAGWDESLRKFIVTNRLLTRRESGYQINLNNNKIGKLSDLSKNSSILTNLENKEVLLFNSAPLKGMNAATTLYWQIPFTTYDPDQFFALGMDGFSPFGWRRFQFRHTLLKTWLYQSQNVRKKQQKPILINKKITLGNSKLNTIDQSLLFKIKEKNYPWSFSQNNSGKYQNSTLTSIFKNKNISRRLKKRYKRVKKHPRSPVWFPSGPLLNKVLPVHYIYVFYKQSRLPRERYLKRRLRSTLQPLNKVKKVQMNLLGQTSKNLNNLDFTLRKRVKTKRNYHIKRDQNSKLILLPKRFKFIGQTFDSLRWRPLSIRKLGLNFNTGNKSIEELVKEHLNFTNKKSSFSQGQGKEKQSDNLLRVKQLKRRVQRQIIRTVWRYRPRAGGFVWPGDYLKLESIKAPLLETQSTFLENKNFNRTDQNDSPTEQVISKKIKRKKKRNISEWPIQPKKYSLEKHNIKTIKKKLKKAQRSNKIKQKIKELNLIF